MVDHFCATYGFLKHFDTKIIYIYILYMWRYDCTYIWCTCQNLCSVKRKFQCPISQLTKTIFTWNFEGDLIDHQPCFIPNFKFLAVQEPNFLEPKFGQNRLLTGFCIFERFIQLGKHVKIAINISITGAFGWILSTVISWVLYVYRPSKRFCTLLGFDFGVT